MPDLVAANKALALVLHRRMSKYSNTCVLNPVQQQNTRYIAKQHAPLHRTFMQTAAQLPSRPAIVYRLWTTTIGMGHGWNKMGCGRGVGLG